MRVRGSSLRRLNSASKRSSVLAWAYLRVLRLNGQFPRLLAHAITTFELARRRLTRSRRTTVLLPLSLNLAETLLPMNADPTLGGGTPGG